MRTYYPIIVLKILVFLDKVWYNINVGLIKYDRFLLIILL